MAGRKKKPASVLGDDPLSWLGKDQTQDTRPGQPEIQAESVTGATEGNETSAPAENTTNAVLNEVNIVLDPVITLTEAGQLKEILLGYVNSPEIKVDAGKVEHIDTAGMQLLLAFSKAVQKQGGKIHWTGWSAACSGTAELLGLTRAAGPGEKNN